MAHALPVRRIHPLGWGLIGSRLLLMLALLLVTSASVRAAVTGPAGLLVVASGAILNFVGWRWMGRIIEGRR